MNEALKILVYSLSIQGVILGIGLIIQIFNDIVIKLGGKLIKVKLMLTLYNYISFIGVIHHELSHIIFALITGAKIKRFKLFRIKQTTDNLGTVIIIPRGPNIIRGLQLSLSAIAPIITGVLSVYYLYTYIIVVYNDLGVRVVAWYIIISILMHMNMSKADFKAYLNGVVSTILISWIILYLVYLVKV